MKMVVTSADLFCRKLVNGTFTDTTAPVVIENELDIVVNGTPLATASLMPGMEREFVLGYLFGQGFITAAADVAALEITETTASVTLPSFGSAGTTSYRIVSGGGKTAFSGSDIPAVTSDISVPAAGIFTAMNRLFSIAEVYRETEAVHAAGLFFEDGKPVCIVEDIGRHNCLDKIIGYTLIHEIDRSRCILVTTGRLSSEMVMKCARAGIAIAATKTAVTGEGRKIALASGLTVIGFVRDAGNRINTDMDVRVIAERSLKIYTGAHRVPC